MAAVFRNYHYHLLLILILTARWLNGDQQPPPTPDADGDKVPLDILEASEKVIDVVRSSTTPDDEPRRPQQHDAIGNTFIDFIDRLFDFKPTRSSQGDGAGRTTVKATDIPSNHDVRDTPDQHLWFFGLKDKVNNDDDKDSESVKMNFASGENDDDSTNDKNSTTGQLDVWLGRVLKRLDSLFNFSQPEQSAATDVGQTDVSKVDYTSVDVNKSEEQPLREFVDSWVESFKTVTENGIPPEPVDDNLKPDAAPASLNTSTLNVEDKPADVVPYEELTALEPSSSSNESLAAVSADSDSGESLLTSVQPAALSPSSSSGEVFSATTTEDTHVDSQEEATQKVSQLETPAGVVIENNNGGSEEVVAVDELDGGRANADGQESSQLFSRVFCQAKCIQMCMSNEGNPFTGCKTVCTASTLKDLCSDNNAACKKACGSSPSNPEFNSPNVTGFKYHSRDNVVDSKVVEIMWEPMAEAVAYVVSIIPDSRSAESGSVTIKEDITNVPWYSFEKGDICFAYYVRVAAVYADGITPFSQPLFVDRSWAKGFPAIYVTSYNIITRTLAVTELTSVKLMEISLPLFSSIITDFNGIQMSSYLLAKNCKNPSLASRMFTGSPAPVDRSAKMLVRRAQFLYLARKVLVRLPMEYVPLDCDYEFRIALVRTRCGEIIPFVSKLGVTFDSNIGADFPMGCKNVFSDNCNGEDDQSSDTLSDTETAAPATAEQAPQESSEKQELQQEGVSCNMTGFSVDVIGNPIDRFNITLMWDAVLDGRPKTYYVKHGRAARKFIRDSATDAGIYDDHVSSEDTDLVIPDDGTSTIARKTVKLNRPLDPMELHLVGVCMAYEGYSPQPSDWDVARRYSIDMAAFPQPVLAIDPPGEFPSATRRVPSKLLGRMDEKPLVEFAPDFNDEQSKADQALSGSGASASDYDRKAASTVYGHRMYLLERYADAYNYWYYMCVAAAFLLIVVSVLFCVVAVRRCCSATAAATKSAADGHSRKFVKLPSPMIFLGRSDSMRKPIMADGEKTDEPKGQTTPKDHVPPV